MNIGTNVLNNLDSQTGNADTTQSGISQSVTKPLSDSDTPISAKGFSSVLQLTEGDSLTETPLLESQKQMVEPALDEVQTQLKSPGQQVISHQQLNIGNTSELRVDKFAQASAVHSQAPMVGKVVSAAASHSMASVSNEIASNSVPKEQLPLVGSANTPQSKTAHLVTTAASGRTQLMSEKSVTTTDLKGQAPIDNTIGRDFSQSQVFKATMPSKDTSTVEVGQKLVAVLADKVSLQSNSKVSNATIRLDPPELGKLDLFVRVEGDRLNVQINSSHAGVREAIAQTVERLRMELTQENFLQVNVTLGDRTEAEPDWNEEQDLNAIKSGVEINNGEFVTNEQATNETEQVIARV